MKVSELIAELQLMPQDMDVYILDADEACLLRLDRGDVTVVKAEKNYPFDRVEIQAPYNDGLGERRMKMVPLWKCESSL